jgi:predicted deacylase
MIVDIRKLCRTCVVVIVALTVAGCATTTPGSARFCTSKNVHVDTNFEGGNFASCEVAGDSSIAISIRPEDSPPINQSPWYAFRVSPRRATEASFSMRFHDGYARYWPKLSSDLLTWEPAEESAVQISEDGTSLTLTLPLDEETIYVSGQELLTTEFYYSWVRELADRPNINSKLLGHSVEGRPIFVVKTANKPEAVILIGRQHPPEVTGAFAMKSFVDVVLGDSEIARQFRERFTVIIIPLVNPDGVARGHWRHNVNGVDLNRDWGPFSQPETQSIARLLSTAEQIDVKLKLMLDFHSTRTNTFYTQLPSESNLAFDFATVWLDRSRQRVPEFEFKHDARPHSGQANTKNYFYDKYGIPAITYELGDETDRTLINDVTPAFAEEMMRTLLETE